MKMSYINVNIYDKTATSQQIAIKMLNKQENQRKESRNVKISENITKMQYGRHRLLGVLHNISENTVGETIIEGASKMAGR